MTVTAGSRYRGECRITRAGFVRIMQAMAAPEVLEAGDPAAYYDAILRYDCDPLFILSVFNHESTMGRYGTARTTHSWGNTRAPTFGANPVGEVAGRSGKFPIFRDWLDGCISTVARLTTPEWYYARENRTIGEVFTKKPEWAPAGDLNDPDGYLRSVLDFMNAHVDQEETPMPYSFIRDLIDIRGYLATNANGGPGYGVPLSSKAGVIVHYSGPAVNLTRSDLDIIKGEAVYHVNKNWGASGQWVSGDGYMYHLCVGRNGEKWLCRDLEAVLWHCGSWPENETWFSVHVPIGEGQRATPKQLQALGEVVNDLLAIRNLGVDRVKGHLEVQSTACPGSLMRDFVWPYRAGTFRSSTPAIAMDHARFDVPATHGEKWVIAPLYRRFAAVEDPIGILGYPITGMALDGDGHEVQAFERAFMRHIPGSWPEKGNVQLDLLGRMAAQVKGYVNNECLPEHPAFQQAQPIEGQRYFEETRHNLGGGFRGFWERYGGLDLFGFPLSEEFQENGRTVQYFERARFEWHPGVCPERFDVLLGLIGAEVIEALGNIA